MERENIRFVRQSQTIKITNLDSKVQNDKKTRKHGDILPDSICANVCGSSNCGKTSVLISLLESSHGVRFENVYTRNRFNSQNINLTNLLAPIEEIGYFTFFSISTERDASEFNFYLWWHGMRQAGRDKRVFCNGTRERRLLLSLSDVLKDIEVSYMRQCKFVDPVQTG